MPQQPKIAAALDGRFARLSGDTAQRHKELEQLTAVGTAEGTLAQARRSLGTRNVGANIVVKPFSTVEVEFEALREELRRNRANDHNYDAASKCVHDELAVRMVTFKQLLSEIGEQQALRAALAMELNNLETEIDEARDGKLHRFSAALALARAQNNTTRCLKHCNEARQGLAKVSAKERFYKKECDAAELVQPPSEHQEKAFAETIVAANRQQSIVQQLRMELIDEQFALKHNEDASRIIEEEVREEQMRLHLTESEGRQVENDIKTMQRMCSHAKARLNTRLRSIENRQVDGRRHLSFCQAIDGAWDWGSLDRELQGWLTSIREKTNADRFVVDAVEEELNVAIKDNRLIQEELLEEENASKKLESVVRSNLSHLGQLESVEKHRQRDLQQRLKSEESLCTLLQEEMATEQRRNATSIADNDSCWRRVHFDLRTAIRASKYAENQTEEARSKLQKILQSRKEKGTEPILSGLSDRSARKWSFNMELADMWRLEQQTQANAEIAGMHKAKVSELYRETNASFKVLEVEMKDAESEAAAAIEERLLLEQWGASEREKMNAEIRISLRCDVEELRTELASLQKQFQRDALLEEQALLEESSVAPDESSAAGSPKSRGHSKSSAASSPKVEAATPQNCSRGVMAEAAVMVHSYIPTASLNAGLESQKREIQLPSIIGNSLDGLSAEFQKKRQERSSPLSGGFWVNKSEGDFSIDDVPELAMANIVRSTSAAGIDLLKKIGLTGLPDSPKKEQASTSEGPGVPAETVRTNRLYVSESQGIQKASGGGHAGLSPSRNSIAQTRVLEKLCDELRSDAHTGRGKGSLASDALDALDEYVSGDRPREHAQQKWASLNETVDQSFEKLEEMRKKNDNFVLSTEVLRFLRQDQRYARDIMRDRCEGIQNLESGCVEAQQEREVLEAHSQKLQYKHTALEVQEGQLARRRAKAQSHADKLRQLYSDLISRSRQMALHCGYAEALQDDQTIKDEFKRSEEDRDEAWGLLEVAEEEVLNLRHQERRLKSQMEWLLREHKNSEELADEYQTIVDEWHQRREWNMHKLKKERDNAETLFEQSGKFRLKQSKLVSEQQNHFKHLQDIRRQQVYAQGAADVERGFMLRN